MKKIKKVSQVIAVVGKVLNSKSTSTQDTYSCDYINKLNEYSNEEKIIGTYIDENGNKKNIYRKIFTANITATSATIAALQQNLNVINMYGTIKYTDNGETYQHNIGSYVNTSFYSLLQYNAANGNVQIFCGDKYINGTLEIILEYTKTTD